MLERGASPRHLAGRVGGRRRAATEFIFMFTQNDITRSDALEVYDAVRSVEGLKFLGFKNIGLDFEDYQALVGAARRDHRGVFLEVISDSESATREAARLGVELGVDYLIGTFPEYVAAALAAVKGQPIKLMPYAGQVFGHPCNLKGSLDDIREDARRLQALGVAGLNILAYRHVSLDGEAVARVVVGAVDVPVVVAGSISTEAQVRKLAEIGVWAFTVGGAVFDRKFAPGRSLADNVRRIIDIVGD